MAIPLALGLYSVRDLYRADFDQCLSAVAAMGYKAVECFGDQFPEVQVVLNALSKHKLTLVGWHVPIDLVEGDKLDSTMAYFDAVNCPRVVVPFMTPETFQTREGIIAFAQRMEKAACKVAAWERPLGYHNHGFEFVKLADGTLPWDLLMENAPHVFGQLDTGNAMSGGDSDLCLFDTIERFPERADTVHLKPFSKEAGFATMFGEDGFPWAEFMQTCTDIGATECFIVEYEDASYEQLVGAQASYTALQKLL